MTSHGHQTRDDEDRPRPVRDTVQGPVTFAGALFFAAMWGLHTILDATIPLSDTVLWSAIEYIVAGGISTGLGALALWWATRRAVRQAERFVTPIVDPAVLRVRDGRVKLVRLIPDPDDAGRAVPIEPVEDVGFADLSDPPPDRPLDTE